MPNRALNPASLALLIGVPLALAIWASYSFLMPENRWLPFAGGATSLYFCFVLLFTCDCYLYSEYAKLSEKRTPYFATKLIIVIAILLWLFSPFWFWANHNFSWLKILAPVLIVLAPGQIIGSIVTGFAVSRNARIRIGSKLGLYFAACLLPTVVLCLFAAYFRDHRIASVMLTVLCGPWATIAIKTTRLPNTGQFFHLPTAILFTVFALALTFTSLYSRDRKITGISLILWNALMGAWYLVGLGQIFNLINQQH